MAAGNSASVRAIFKVVPIQYKEFRYIGPLLIICEPYFMAAGAILIGASLFLDSWHFVAAMAVGLLVAAGSFRDLP
jgi:hypothetical protein